MDLDKIKSGRTKPKFIIALEWMAIATISVLVLTIIAFQFLPSLQLAVGLLSFVLLIEIGILSVLYGAEGIRFQLIWLTYMTPDGPKRLGFRGTRAIIVSLFYVLSGLLLLILALAYAYLNTGGSA